MWWFLEGKDNCEHQYIQNNMALVEKLAYIIYDFVSRAGLSTLFMVLLILFLLRALIRVWNGPKPCKNPMSAEFLREPAPLVLEKEKRDAVLKEVGYIGFKCIADENLLRFYLLHFTGMPGANDKRIILRC